MAGNQVAGYFVYADYKKIENTQKVFSIYL